jgi:hypothetical protein
VGARQFILEDGPHKTIVEETRRTVDYVQWFGLRIVGAHSA